MNKAGVHRQVAVRSLRGSGCLGTLQGMGRYGAVGRQAGCTGKGRDECEQLANVCGDGR
jgi:hypothetical protein